MYFFLGGKIFIFPTKGTILAEGGLHFLFGATIFESTPEASTGINMDLSISVWISLSLSGSLSVPLDLCMDLRVF